MIEAVIYLLAIVVAESFTVFYMPLWGILCHVGILVVLIVHSAVTSRYPHRPLLLSLTLVPLVRIITLCMPLADIPQMWWYPIIYTPLLAATIVVMSLLNYSPGKVGLNLKRLPVQSGIAMTGFGFGIAEYFILKPESMVTEPTWQTVWLPALLLFICTGFVEELIFRGVLQCSAMEAFAGWGIVYISLLFAILHMGFLLWLDVVFVFIVALFFGWVVQKTGSLVGVILSHGITNVVLYFLAPLVLG